MIKFLKPLILMQLKDRIDLSSFKTPGEKLRKIVFVLLRFILVALLAYAFMFICSLLGIFSLYNFIPVEVILIVFSFIIILEIISCTNSLVKQLYLAPDNMTLMILPVKHNIVFISKLVVAYIYELIKNFFFLMPILFAYGINARLTFLFFLWLPIALMFIVAFITIISALFSIPAMFFYRIVRRFPGIKEILFILLLLALCFVAALLINLIPENIRIIGNWRKIYWYMQDVITWFNRVFKPLDYLLTIIIGEMVNIKFQVLTINASFYLAILIVVSFLLLLICYYVSLPLYYKMISYNFEYSVNKTNHKKNKPHSLFFSSIVKEFKVMLRSSNLLYNFLLIYILMPVVILFMNKIYGAMNRRLLGLNLTYTFNIILILLPYLASNGLIATLYSRDGKKGNLNKTYPVNPLLSLTSRLTFYLVFSSLSILVSALMFNEFAELNTRDIGVLIISLIAINAGHMLISASYDITNPKYASYEAKGESAANSNETKSTIQAFIIAFGIGVFSYLLFSQGLESACSRLLIISALYLFGMIVLYVRKIKIYYGDDTL